MNVFPAQTHPIGTTTGAVAIRASFGDNDVAGRARTPGSGFAPSDLLPQQVTVRPANAVGRERVWCDAIR